MHTRARFLEGDASRSPFYECFAHPLCAVPSTLRWQQLSAPWKLDGSMPTPSMARLPSLATCPVPSDEPLRRGKAALRSTSGLFCQP
jgi:hypothetical protein